MVPSTLWPAWGAGLGDVGEVVAVLGEAGTGL